MDGICTTMLPRQKFQSRMKKTLKHELVYDILKKDMPKFQLNLLSIDSRVRRPVLLLEWDAELVAAAAAPGVVAVPVAPRTGGVVPVVLASSLLSSPPDPRPLERFRQRNLNSRGSPLQRKALRRLLVQPWFKLLCSKTRMLVVAAL